MSCQSSICLHGLLGTHCGCIFQKSICLHDVMGSHCWCIVDRLFVSMMSLVLIGSVIILLLITLYQGYSMKVCCKSSICLHVSMVLIGDILSSVLLSPRVLIGSVLLIVCLSPLCHGYSLWMYCQSSICLHYAMGSHWECLDNCLFVSIMSWVLIGSVLTTVYLSPLCHGFSLGVS